MPIPELRSLPAYGAGDVDVPYVIAGNSEVIERDTSWNEHSHPTHELLWNERGASTATVGSRTWTITRVVGLWIPAGTPHSGWTPAGTWQRTAQFSVLSTRSLSEGALAIELTPLLRLLLDRLAEPLDERSRAITEAMVLDVLEPAPHEVLLHIPGSTVTRPIVDAVRADPADATTLAEWASRLGVSTRTITRVFRSETGLGFSQWIAAARSQHAVMLLGRGLDVEQVAALVGYASPSAFGAAFRRVTGTSPGRLRSR